MDGRVSIILCLQNTKFNTMLMHICVSENGNDFHSGSEIDTEDELEIARKVGLLTTL